MLREIEMMNNTKMQRIRKFAQKTHKFYAMIKIHKNKYVYTSM